MSIVNRVLKFLSPETGVEQTLTITQDDAEMLHSAMALFAACMHYNAAGARSVMEGARRFINHEQCHKSMDHVGNFLFEYLEACPDRPDTTDESASWKNPLKH